MSTLDPLSTALKYGFLVVFYLFLLWVAWSATRELRGRAARRGGGVGGVGGAPSADPMLASSAAVAPDATGMHSASTLGPVDVLAHAPRLAVERAPGHEPGMIYDLDGDVLLGRGSHAEIRLEDPFASSAHARIFEQGGILAVEDLGSTNGTYLNEELLESPRPLHPGDRLRIGDSEFTFEID